MTRPFDQTPHRVIKKMIEGGGGKGKVDLFEKNTNIKEVRKANFENSLVQQFGTSIT